MRIPRRLGLTLAALALLGATGATLLPEPASPLRALTELSAQRLATADRVAAAKWIGGDPIDDPAREREVIRLARAEARRAGTDPDVVARVFRDQIDANKLVQRALHGRWQADPGTAPPAAGDGGNAGELSAVRAEIDRLNADLLTELAELAELTEATEGRAGADCPAQRGLALDETRDRRGLDPLHTRALGHALRSVCPAAG
ncbi:gamma subclass chorismate mutase AroQ [Streptomyces profundus]|uniref:gamma subclass chorismate mutase AroQ n=1 Tax=Streptomyces profundus TaxID=2867410 RepID=UPI001D162B2A|nr:gamma subclass chorismate mutase AroQ [Streptomyces sp. MA3_2.13]UED85552.1 gamma subclass chorismate mutase AroQ [Streptomyces sp. MA3_2.13]